MSAPRLNFPYGSGGGGGGVSGTGTPPALAMWATSSSLTDSPLSFASQTLTFAPSVRFFTFGHHQQWTIPANAYGFAINNQLVLDTGSGYLGVNPPTTPASPLHVEGTVGSSSEMVRLRNQLAGINSHVTIQTHANALGASSPTGKIQNYTTALTPGYGVYDWVYSLPNPNGVMTEVFRQTAPTTILTLTLTSGGSGYTNGTYSQVALTNVSSSGSGATADIVVAGGIVTVAVLRSGGSTYQVGDTLTCASIGGGTGFVLTVASVGSRATAAGNVTATRIGAGTTTPMAGVDSRLSAFITGSQWFANEWVSGSIADASTAMWIDRSGPAVQAGQNLNYNLTLRSNLDMRGMPAFSNTALINGWATQTYSDVAGLASSTTGVGAQATRSFATDLNPNVTLNGVSGGCSARNIATNTARMNGGNFSCSTFTGYTGTIADVRAVAASVSLLSASTATSVAIFDGAISLTTGGAATTFYGLRLRAGNFTAPSVAPTTYYGISQEDALATNYFAGNVGVNTTTPKDRLHVANGSIKVGADAIDSFLSFGDEGVATRNNGVYRPASSNTLAIGSYNQITFNVSATTLGSQTNRGTIDATQASFTVPVRATGTSASAVAFSGFGDPNTGMYFPGTDTVRIAGGANIGMEIDSNGVFSINNGYGGLAPAYGCRAWVNFDSTVSGSWAGGVSTVTRAAGSTTATVTTTSNHGLITGNSVYALSGVAVGYYTITYVGVKTFTITTVATTALSAVPITFAVNNIRASGGVSSVTDISTGIFSVNFSTAMPDINYSAIGIKQNVSSNSNVSLYDCLTTVGSAPGRTTTQCGWQCIESAVATDSTNVNIAVFR